MKVDAFDFVLPEERIAQHAIEPRDASRMLVVDDGFTDATICQLTDYVRAGDILVFNDTKVIPARLFGQRGKAGIELLLHKAVGPNRWLAFARPAKRLQPNDLITFAEEFSAIVAKKHTDGQIELGFNTGRFTLEEQLERYGIMPLPPYIKRERTGDADDTARYQTVFATYPGAVAAPTAGLHFTPELLEAIAKKGAHTAFVTLHVGAGTFQPVKVDDTSEHKMHSEWAQLTAKTATEINDAKARGGRVIAVGTTSLRTLESATDAQGAVSEFIGDTSIFITPGYRFKLVDLLVTNFHLPRSTLFMLVSAFCGLDRMQRAYRHAIEQKYRFYSYGDACLLFRQDDL